MDTLNVKLESLDEKVMFSAIARENPQITIDYTPPIGTGKGYTSLELLMASFGSCVSTTILTLLRYKMQKTINNIVIDLIGEVRDKHPKALESIKMTLHIKANDLTKSEVQQALKTAEEEVCPVWAMLKGNVKIITDVDIIDNI